MVRSGRGRPGAARFDIARLTSLNITISAKKDDAELAAWQLPLRLGQGLRIDQAALVALGSGHGWAQATSEHPRRSHRAR